MKSWPALAGCLLVVGALVAASCQATAAGVDGGPSVAPADDEAPESIVEAALTLAPATSADVRSPSVLISGPARYVYEAGVYRLHIAWSHHLTHPDLEIDATAVVEAEMTPSGLWSRTDVDVDLAIDGEVTLDMGSVTCRSRFAGQVCGLSAVTDAGLTGTAELRGTNLAIQLNWRRFGPSQLPGRVSMQIARWPDGGTPLDALDRVELIDIADALETAGLIGRPLVIDVGRPQALNVAGISQWGSGTGVFTLVPVR